MATRGRKRLGEQRTTSQQRKASFDKRMRNADGARPGVPQRKPCVVYLSDESREVLRRNRALTRLADSVAETDSEFLERLLLNRKLPSHLPDASAHVSEDYVHSLLKAQANLQKQVNELQVRELALEATSEVHPEDELALISFDEDCPWDAVAAALCRRHDAEQWSRTFSLTERLRTMPIQTITVEELTRRLHGEVREHLLDLCFLRKAKSG